MKRGLLVMIGLCSICSCTTSREKEELRLDGDWMYLKDTTEIVVNYVGLRFLDDTLFTIKNGGLWQEGRYFLRGDTVYVEEFGGKLTTYEVLKFSADSLRISRYGHSDDYYSRRLEFNPELEFNEIKLEGGTCFGECPHFVMTVERNGEVNFKGLKNGKFIGNKEYLIEKEKINKIDSLFKWSYINKIDTTDFYGEDDGWSINITFYYNNGQVTTIKGTRNSMPFRLYGIIWTLLEDLRKRDLI